MGGGTGGGYRGRRPAGCPSVSAALPALWPGPPGPAPCPSAPAPAAAHCGGQRGSSDGARWGEGGRFASGSNHKKKQRLQQRRKKLRFAAIRDDQERRPDGGHTQRRPRTRRRRGGGRRGPGGCPAPAMRWGRRRRGPATQSEWLVHSLAGVGGISGPGGLPARFRAFAAKQEGGCRNPSAPSVFLFHLLNPAHPRSPFGGSGERRIDDDEGASAGLRKCPQ